MAFLESATSNRVLSSNPALIIMLVNSIRILGLGILSVQIILASFQSLAIISIVGSQFSDFFKTLEKKLGERDSVAN